MRFKNRGGGRIERGGRRNNFVRRDRQQGINRNPENTFQGRRRGGNNFRRNPNDRDGRREGGKRFRRGDNFRRKKNLNENDLDKDLDNYWKKGGEECNNFII
jgi:hypothetical protein